MNCEINTPKNKGIIDNIIKIENNYTDSVLKLYYKINPINIMSIIRYLNNNGWKNFKFNQYSVKQIDDHYIIFLNYITQKVSVFK